MSELDFVDDLELARRTQVGDKSAFTTLVIRHRDAIINAVAAIIPPGLTSALPIDDVTQDVILLILQILDKFDPDRPDSSFRAWACGVARNTVLKQVTYETRQKRDARRTRSASTWEDEDGNDFLEQQAKRFTTPSKIVSGAEIEAAIRSIVDLLPPQQRELFGMLFDQGLSCAEIGRRLGKTSGVISMRRRRLFDRLQRELNGRFG